MAGLEAVTTLLRVWRWGGDDELAKYAVSAVRDREVFAYRIQPGAQIFSRRGDEISSAIRICEEWWRKTANTERRQDYLLKNKFHHDDAICCEIPETISNAEQLV